MGVFGPAKVWIAELLGWRVTMPYFVNSPIFHACSRGIQEMADLPYHQKTKSLCLRNYVVRARETGL